MAPAKSGVWWLPIALMVSGVAIGILGWYWKRMLDRLDNAHDGVYKDGGPVSTVRQELTTIRLQVAKCMTREEGEANNKSLREQMDAISKEGREREDRLMEAIRESSRAVHDSVGGLKADIRSLVSRVDNLNDRR